MSLFRLAARLHPADFTASVISDGPLITHLAPDSYLFVAIQSVGCNLLAGFHRSRSRGKLPTTGKVLDLQAPHHWQAQRI